MKGQDERPDNRYAVFFCARPFALHRMIGQRIANAAIESQNRAKVELRARSCLVVFSLAYIL